MAASILRGWRLLHTDTLVAMVWLGAVPRHPRIEAEPSLKSNHRNGQSLLVARL